MGRDLGTTVTLIDFLVRWMKSRVCKMRQVIIAESSSGLTKLQKKVLDIMSKVLVGWATY